MTPWDLPEKLRRRVRVDESGCWHYTGPKTQWGYGIVSTSDRERLAHRIAYRTLVGDIPEGYQIDHLCRIPRCCNPEHLEAVTPQENRRRSPNAPENRTHCHAGHPLSGENVRRNDKGARVCVACHREWSRAYQRRRYQESKRQPA